MTGMPIEHTEQTDGKSTDLGMIKYSLITD